MFANLRAVLFDAVGTLIYPNPPVAEAYLIHGRQFGASLSQDEIAQRFSAAFASQERADWIDRQSGRESLHRRMTSQRRERQRWQTIVADVFHDVQCAGGPLFESLWRHFADGRNWSVYDDVLPAIERLQARDFTLGIASNFDRRLDEICRQHRPLSACRHVFSSARIGCPKPSPQFFATVQQELGLTPEQILLVGDDPTNDYLGGKAAGWRVLLINRRDQSIANGQIHSLVQLDRLLR